jgi:Tfp pilus assembly protein PilO
MRARLNAWLDRLGAAGVIALGLLCFDAALLLSGVLPMRERAAAAESRLRAAEALRPGTRASSSADPIERLLAVFPPQAAVPDELERLFRLAEEQRLQLQQGDYRLEKQGELLQVYRVSLPLRGSYAQVRAFVAAALNAMPYLALDSIRFERQRVGDASVETQVKFSLFLSAARAKSAGDPATR